MMELKSNSCTTRSGFPSSSSMKARKPPGIRSSVSLNTLSVNGSGLRVPLVVPEEWVMKASRSPFDSS